METGESQQRVARGRWQSITMIEEGEGEWRGFLEEIHQSLKQKTYQAAAGPACVDKESKRKAEAAGHPDDP